MKRAMPALACVAIACVSIACVAAGCGSAGASGEGQVTIAVTSRGYTEEKVLREIYAHSLEAAGFRVKRVDDPNALPPEELEKGIVSGYPDHLENALMEVGQLALAEVPTSTEAAYREARGRLAGKGLVPLPPTSFSHSNAVALRRTTAKRLGVRSLSDLAPSARRMSVGEGVYFCYCYGRECLASLEHDYGIAFGGYSTVQPQPRLYAALRKGETDAAVVPSSDGRLAHENPWLVVLEDKQHQTPASNAIWITSQEVLDEAGPDYERAILAAQKDLTLQVIRRLNAEVELEGKRPAEVAADYLDSIGQGG
jgi:glycine betaine/choline ABC-type transport system substrate-binding protein